MDGAGHEFLAGPALPQDEHVHVQGRGVGDEGQCFGDGPAAADHATALAHPAQGEQPADDLPDLLW